VPLLELNNVTIQFPTPAGAWLSAVRDVNLSLSVGETLGLVGESGSGKSVTSLAILQLLPPQARITGQILLDGRNLLDLASEEIRAVRGSRISMIFQEPMTALNPVMRVGDQIAEAILAHRASGPDSVTKTQAWGRALAAMRDVGIPDFERRARDFPHHFSGGQRQRVMIAMALVNRPELLIADEPTTALDVTIQAQILDLLAELREKFRLAMLFISHDLAVVSRVAHRTAVMYASSVVEIGDSAEVFANPAHPYTRGLLAAVPTLKTDRAKQMRTIEGSVPSISALPPGCPFEPRCDWRVDDCGRHLPALIQVAPNHWARCPVATHSIPDHLSTSR
jgi:oligopeptide/dipeptide ABC transporter ATP-binding protein